MNRAFRLVAVLSLTVMLIGTLPLDAMWPGEGLPICTQVNEQSVPVIASDEEGGAIIFWRDSRSGSMNLYAQRIGPEGDPIWAPEGVLICNTLMYSPSQRIIPDGEGGAILVWSDYRSIEDITAQKIDADGNVQWAENGVAICTGSYSYNPQLTTDGAGGAFIAWEQYDPSLRDLYIQLVDASGTVQWAVDGLVVSQGTNHQVRPRLVSDGAGGAYVTFYDNRVVYNEDIYAQRYDTTGPRWVDGGIKICNALPTDQDNPEIASDGANGAVITWKDERNTGIYAQRVDSTGAVYWTTDGIAVCAAAGTQQTPQIAADGNGFYVIVWEDQRNGDWDIYAQKIDNSGLASWSANGIPVCAAAGDQLRPRISAGPDGSVVITWQDGRSSSGYRDIYAQKIDGEGLIQWAEDGTIVCAASDEQLYPEIVSDGDEGAIITWQDLRGGDYDIYAQNVINGYAGFNLRPTIHAVRDVPGDQGGSIYLSWYATGFDIIQDEEISHYTVWRAISAIAAALITRDGVPVIHRPSDIPMISPVVGTCAVGSGPGVVPPVVMMEQSAGLTYFWELVGSQQAYFLDTYAMTVPTLFDSSDVCSEYHYFQVIAHTTDPHRFWKSDSDSGYSVDNLAPCPPAMLAAEKQYDPEGLLLTWAPNTESDLDCYHVYRGTSSSFEPATGNLVGSPCDTLVLDGSWSWDRDYWYKVAAVDIHGNESGYAVLGPDMITGDDPAGIPSATYLSQNYPNPFNPATNIYFGLSEAGHVSLKIYDVAGRLVAVIVEEERPAGVYGEVWNGDGRAGGRASSGIYFYRLEAAGSKFTKKMVLLR